MPSNQLEKVKKNSSRVFCCVKFTSNSCMHIDYTWHSLKQHVWFRCSALMNGIALLISLVKKNRRLNYSYNYID